MAIVGTRAAPASGRIRVPHCERTRTAILRVKASVWRDVRSDCKMGILRAEGFGPGFFGCLGVLGSAYRGKALLRRVESESMTIRLVF